MYNKWQSYNVWFLRYGVWQTEFFVIFDNFLPIYPLKTWKIKSLKKWKKSLEILSFFTSVPKIMIICYTVPKIWHVTDVIVIFHFGFIFCPFFYLCNSPKTEKFLKNEKTTWRYHHFTHVPKIMIIWYTVPEILHITDVTYFSFWAISYPPPPLP